MGEEADRASSLVMPRGGCDGLCWEGGRRSDRGGGVAGRTRCPLDAVAWGAAGRCGEEGLARATHTILRSNTPQRIMCHGALSMMDDRRFVSSLALHGMLPATHVYGA
eukprot:CCRYP_018930-RD/>CCRYP_018930-RD protein AED:0.48 eAED:1.00 QI:0/0/0/1/0/0/2/0/107